MRAYLEQEESQNAKWASVAALLPPGEEADYHRNGIAQKRRVISSQRDVLDQFFSLHGVDPTTPESWGTAFDRFQKVGEALEYRTTYAALCSQAHNDAEDLINGFTLQLIGTPTSVESLGHETRAFSWLAVMLGLKHYVRAAAAYWRYFNLLPSDLADKAIVSMDLLAADAAGRVQAAGAGAPMNSLGS